ncbi:transcription antitermination protein, partial [Halobium palmae]
ASQMVGFFVGDADTSTADTFRDVKDDLDAEIDEAVETLGEVCVRDEDWDAAREAASAVLEAAYDDYVETLEGMGVEPKNVC